MKTSPLFKVIIIIVTLFLVSMSVYAASIEVPHDVEVSVIGDEEQSNGIFYIKIPDGKDFADANAAIGKEENPSESTENDGTLPEDEEDPAADDSLDLDGNPLPTWEPSGEYLADIDIMILVNKENPVDETFVPQDLVELESVATNRSAEWQVMTREAADAFNKLAADAKALGYEILATTAYRSYNFQSYLYNSYVQRDGQAAADTYSARPGKSEHQ
ncbi:MAG: M15 family metallopeptidase, partial [Firmicutes bacterium]|nr:M15 family metallopeptidase [Bacillota bacterium]